jgi:UDP-N-acetylenolpyruvoylglucosamine reductase
MLCTPVNTGVSIVNLAMFDLHTTTALTFATGLPGDDGVATESEINAANNHIAKTCISITWLDDKDMRRLRAQFY